MEILQNLESGILLLVAVIISLGGSLFIGLSAWNYSKIDVKGKISGMKYHEILDEFISSIENPTVDLLDFHIFGYHRDGKSIGCAATSVIARLASKRHTPETIGNAYLRSVLVGMEYNEYMVLQHSFDHLRRGNLYMFAKDLNANSSITELLKAEEEFFASWDYVKELPTLRNESYVINLVFYRRFREFLEEKDI